MSRYPLVAIPEVEPDVESAFTWYQQERTGLGLEFLDEVEAVYDRINEAPESYTPVGSDVRRALMRRFPYVVYFALRSEVVVILAVLHASRDPSEWQRRGR